MRLPFRNGSPVRAPRQRTAPARTTYQMAASSAAAPLADADEEERNKARRKRGRGTILGGSGGSYNQARILG
jgi:hypothetical protein